MSAETDLVVRPDLENDLLLVEIINRSEHPVEVYEHSLPWVGWHSMILAAVITDPVGTPIPKDLRIDDPGPTIVTIQSGEKLKGEVPLRLRFPEWSSARSQRDVILLWAYRFQPLDEPAGGWSMGSILFPRLAPDAPG